MYPLWLAILTNTPRLSSPCKPPSAHLESVHVIKITSILSTIREMISTANALLDDVRTLKEGTEMMEHANAAFREVLFGR